MADYFFRCTDDQLKQLAVNAINASGPSGQMSALVFAMELNKADNDKPWNEMVGVDDLPEDFGEDRRGYFIDYFRGRMVKFRVYLTVVVDVFRLSISNASYQDWLKVYGSGEGLLRSVDGVEVLSDVPDAIRKKQADYAFASYERPQNKGVRYQERDEVVMGVKRMLTAVPPVFRRVAIADSSEQARDFSKSELRSDSAFGVLGDVGVLQDNPAAVEVHFLIPGENAKGLRFDIVLVEKSMEGTDWFNTSVLSCLVEGGQWYAFEPNAEEG